MTYLELIRDSEFKLEHNEITLGEYYEMTEPLRREIEQESKTDILNSIVNDIQNLRGCSCGCSDGIIDDVEDIINKYKSEG